MGAGGGGHLDEYRASGGDTANTPEKAETQGSPEIPEPTWEQLSPNPALADDPDPTEWTIIWLRWGYRGAFEVKGTVKMTRAEIDKHIQANMSFDVTGSDGRKGTVPAGKVIWHEVKEDEG